MAIINVNEQMYRRMLDRGILTQEIYRELVEQEGKRKLVKESIEGKDLAKSTKAELLAVIADLIK